jgi:hypothetical protein
LAVLEESLNKKAGNLVFSGKRLIYAQSQISTTMKIASDNSEWNAQRLAARQRQMARVAKAIWRLPQIDN